MRTDTFAAQTVIAEEMKRDGVSVVIARAPCALIPKGRGQPEQVVRLDREKCRLCEACMKIMCPALVAGPDGYPQIDAESCNGCGLCVRVCRFDALLQGGTDHDQ